MTFSHRFVIAILALGALTTSCGGPPSLFKPGRPNLTDPALDLTRDDYRNITEPAAPAIPEMADVVEPVGTLKTKRAVNNVIEPPIPDIAEILAAPKPPKLGETKLVSVAVTDDVPLKDVLIEMARLADVDVEIDASITGGISFRAKDRPFNEVIERISALAGLRYTMKNNVLRIERDTPYVQIYSLDFLNLDRGSQSNISINTNVLSGGGGSGGGSGGSGGSSGGSSGGGGSGGLNTGSNASVSAKSEIDFWKQFDAGIKQILAYSESKRVSGVDIAEQDASKSTAKKETPPPAAGKTAADSAAAAEASAATAQSNYTLNRQGATLTVSATDHQHQMVKEFIRRIQANSSAQVIIEAKIVEVTLNDDFQSGIDWSRFGSDTLNFSGPFTTPGTPITNTGTVNFGKNFTGANNPVSFFHQFDMASAIKLAERFGTTRTLSSPRLHAMNNQEAVLTFARNHVYFELKVEQTQSSNSTTTTTTTSGLNTITVNSTLHTVPIGIIMTLQPSINLDTNEVTLSVRPTLSRITGTVNDPAVAFIIAQTGLTNLNVSNAVPIVEVRELDSILKLKSGQVMVIGGLMQDLSNNTDSGIPGASSVPVVGNLFKGVDKSNNLSELVIFIRATIVDSNGSAAPADKALYQKYTKDPRPLEFN